MSTDCPTINPLCLFCLSEHAAGKSNCAYLKEVNGDFRNKQANVWKNNIQKSNMALAIQRSKKQKKKTFQNGFLNLKMMLQYTTSYRNESQATKI